MGGSRGRGAGVDGQPPSFRTAHQKNKPKYNAWKNIRNDTWVPKKSRKLPVTISSQEKRAHYETCALTPQVITSKSQETTVELRRWSTPVSNFLRKSVINRYILNGKNSKLNTCQYPVWMTQKPRNERARGTKKFQKFRVKKSWTKIIFLVNTRLVHRPQKPVLKAVFLFNTLKPIVDISMHI